jgi:hypothetical protein
MIQTCLEFDSLDIEIRLEFELCYLGFIGNVVLDAWDFSFS